MPSTVDASTRHEARLLAPASVDAAALARWQSLAGSARFANPFQGPAMLRPALHHLAGDDDLRLLVAPGLLVPLTVRRRFRRLPQRAAVGWQHTHHFLGTPLVSPDLGADGWRAALDVLERDGDDPWLVLTDVDTALADDVERAAAADGRAVRRLGSVERPVTVRRPVDDYLERQLSGSRRKELRRVRRRLEEACGGDLRVVDLAADGRVEEGIDTFLRIESAGWKGSDGGAIAVDPGERAFFTEACHDLAERGSLHLLALQGRDGEPAAMAVDVRDGATLFTVKTTYDERHAAWSPGLLLYIEQLHRFHASGAELLDTCAAPGHPMASRLHPDRRALTTLAVALRGRRGALAVRTAPRLLDAVDRGRPLARRLARRPATTSTSHDRPDTTEDPR